MSKSFANVAIVPVKYCEFCAYSSEPFHDVELENRDGDMVAVDYYYMRCHALQNIMQNDSRYEFPVPNCCPYLMERSSNET